MFILLLHYKKTLEEVAENLEAHRAYLDKYYKTGKFICSGPRNPRTGGCILCHGLSRAEVEKIIREDPFHSKGIADYEILEMIPTKYAEGAEKYFL